MFLFAAHRPEMWWYEVVETVRRLTMTSFLVLFRDHQIRLAVASLLSFVSILLHTTTKPFSDPATNTLALVSHLLVFLVVFVAQQISVGVVETTDFWAGIILVIFLLALPVLMVHSIMTQAQRDRIEDVRRRERDVQAEEMFAIVNQLKHGYKVRRDVPLSPREESNIPEIRIVPCVPPPSLNMSMSDVNFEKSDFPCYVMSLTNLCGLDKLPMHEDAKEAGLLEILTLNTDASNRNQAEI